MSRSRYSGRSGSHYRSRSHGRARALVHIAAAKRLTAELGGMDQGVKSYFFSLPPDELTAILDDYQRAYGSIAREYATKTIAKWRARRVQMSGMVAERLFNLLPPRMPLEVKYKLVEGLWHHVGPSSKLRIRVGADASAAEVVELARSKITEFVVNYKIPGDLERRFNWLSADDVSVKQLLLSHVQAVEKAVVVEAVRAQVPVMLEHIRDTGWHTGRLAQIVHVGKHELELLMDKAASGVCAEDPSSFVLSKSNSVGFRAGIGWALATILVVLSTIGGYLLVQRAPAEVAAKRPLVYGADQKPGKSGPEMAASETGGNQIAPPPDLSAAVRVIDGDTLDVDGTRIRLWGIDAPELSQTCQGRDGQIYECGRDSAAVMRELTRERAVKCETRDHDRYGRVVAVCRTESGEINAAIVRRGWAVDWPKYSHGKYRPEEKAARAEGLGIWSGRFEFPWEWRREHQH